MNKIEMFVVKKMLASEEGQDLLKEQLSNIAAMATDPQVILGIMEIGKTYIGALADGLRALDDEDKKELVNAGLEVAKVFQEYIAEAEALSSGIVNALQDTEGAQGAEVQNEETEETVSI